MLPAQAESAGRSQLRGGFCRRRSSLGALTSGTKRCNIVRAIHERVRGEDRHALDKPTIHDWRQRWPNTPKKTSIGLCRPNGRRSNEGKSITASSSRFRKERKSIYFLRPGTCRFKGGILRRRSERSSC